MGFLELRCLNGVSEEVRRGAQGDSLQEREDGGVSGVSSSCGARGGFLPSHDEDLREPLVRRQGGGAGGRRAEGREAEGWRAVREEELEGREQREEGLCLPQPGALGP